MNTFGDDIMFHRKSKRYISKRQLREIRTAWTFLLPSMAGVIIFILFPFMDAVRRSFYEAMGGMFVGVKNYKTIIDNEAFRLAIKNTGRFMLVCIPILMFFSLFLSVLINGIKKYQNFFKTSFLLPMGIPVASVVLLWKLAFSRKGLLNHIIVLLGGNDSDCLMQTTFVVFVLSMVNSLKVFREAYLVAGNYPDSSIYMLQHLFNNWFVNLDIQKICAAAVLVTAVIIVFILLVQKISSRLEGED